MYGETARASKRANIIRLSKSRESGRRASWGCCVIIFSSLFSLPPSHFFPIQFCILHLRMLAPSSSFLLPLLLLLPMARSSLSVLKTKAPQLRPLYTVYLVCNHQSVVVAAAAAVACQPNNAKSPSLIIVAITRAPCSLSLSY